MTTAIIPAKPKSQGVEDKNLRPIAGKSLLQRTIDCAKEANINTIVVSSYSEEILNIAHDNDVFGLKTEQNFHDNTSATNVVLHAIEYLKTADGEPVFLLQPTSPLRKPEHCREAVDILTSNHSGKDISVVGVTVAPKTISLRFLNLSNMIKPVFNLSKAQLEKPRQEVVPIFQVNGAIFLAYAKTLRENGTFLLDDCYGYIMPLSESVEIDDPDDWYIAETLLQREERK